MAKHTQREVDENEIIHVNVLDLKSIRFGVFTYCKDKNFKHIRIMSNKTTATSSINKKVAWNLMNLTILQKKSWFGVIVEAYS